MISSAISNLPDLETDTWVKASFDDLLALAKDA